MLNTLILFILKFQEINIDSVRIDEIKVNNVPIFSNVEIFTNKFGSPDSIITRSNEFTDKKYFDYYFGKNKIYVEDGVITGFWLYNNDIKLSPNIISVRLKYKLNSSSRVLPS